MCDLPSLTEESKEARTSIHNSARKIISETAEFQNQSLLIDKKDFDIFDNMEREQIVLDDSSIEQNCETSESDTRSSSNIVKIENDEYVYRLLRFHESYSKGLQPKNVFSRISPEKHVRRGSKGYESRFISSSANMNGLNRLIRLTNKSSRVCEVVRINMTKLKGFKDVTIINLTDENVREKHIDRKSKAWGYAHNFKEVVLAPKSHIPAECVERIGIVKDQQFIKDEHINL